MNKKLVILTHVETAAISKGFLPAAKKNGLDVVIITDHAAEHNRYFSQPNLTAYPDAILACDVFNPLAVIELIEQRIAVDAVFSNSDHLQASTALIASYFDLPGKDWRVCYRAKNKASMRAQLQNMGADTLWFSVVSGPGELDELASDVKFPCVIKPREGVASRGVCLIKNQAQLDEYCQSFWVGQPGQALLLEAYMSGALVTLETLGDGQSLEILGGFQVELSEPPYFVELMAHWDSQIDREMLAKMAQQVMAFGVQFGACHSEFVLTEQGPRLIEMNYRSVGGDREFLLQETLGIPLFEIILRLHMGESLPELKFNKQSAIIQYISPLNEGIVKRSPDAYQTLFLKGELQFHPLRTPGDRVSIEHSNKDCLGILKAFGQDLKQIKAQVSIHFKQLENAWEIDA